MKSSQEVVEKWEKLVRAFGRSEMTRREFCDRNQIKPYQLDYWRSRLRDSRRLGHTAAETWIPLQIRDDHASEDSAAVTLHIGRVTIDVRSGFDAELLAEVLRVVGPTC